MYAVPAPPDHFWLCPIPFVLEYPDQPDHSKSGGAGPELSYSFLELILTNNSFHELGCVVTETYRFTAMFYFACDISHMIEYNGSYSLL